MFFMTFIWGRKYRARRGSAKGVRLLRWSGAVDDVLPGFYRGPTFYDNNISEKPARTLCNAVPIDFGDKIYSADRL